MDTTWNLRLAFPSSSRAGLVVFTGVMLGTLGSLRGRTPRCQRAFRSPRNSGLWPNGDSSYLRSANEMKLPIFILVFPFELIAFPQKQYRRWKCLGKWGNPRETAFVHFQLGNSEVSADLTELGSLGDGEVFTNELRLQFRVHPDCIWVFWSFCGDWRTRYCPISGI